VLVKITRIVELLLFLLAILTQFLNNKLFLLRNCGVISLKSYKQKGCKIDIRQVLVWNYLETESRDNYSMKTS